MKDTDVIRETTKELAIDFFKASTSFFSIWNNVSYIGDNEMELGVYIDLSSSGLADIRKTVMAMEDTLEDLRDLEEELATKRIEKEEHEKLHTEG